MRAAPRRGCAAFVRGGAPTRIVTEPKFLP
jgi:hypothetical protein